ncbi:MAG: lysophospholipid acyltransferase family protein, partial [Candidatus Acidiferrum sp.]
FALSTQTQVPQEEVPVLAESEEGKFTLRQRFSLWLVSGLGFFAIRLICPTLRWQVNIEEGGAPRDRTEPAIYCFWHRCVFLATYFYRNKGIRVMTSRSFDGEYIARIIEKFGYGAVRGSSTRGGVRALLKMHKDLEGGSPVAFTVDGPLGPRYVAKPGPVLLARNSGAPILPFYITVDRAWTLKTWDGFIIPKPFARAYVNIARLIRVPADADSAGLERWHAEMQAALERVRDAAEADAAQVE